MEPKDVLKMLGEAFELGGRDPRIEDLARVQDAVAKLQEAVLTAEETVKNSPEWKALQEAQKAFEETEAQKALVEAVKDHGEADQLFADMVAGYKARQLREFDEAGQTDYPGGNIQVRTRFVLVNPEDLLSKLIEKGLKSYLMVDQKKMGKELNPDVAIALDLDPYVDWEKYPVASLSKDLSEYLEAN